MLFLSLKDDAVYSSLVPYYIGEIYLLQGNYEQAVRWLNAI